MSRKCKACNSPNRNAIENAVLEGRSLKDVAAEHGMSTVSLWRHRKNHMAKESQEAILASGQGLLPLPLVVSPEKAERIGRHIDAVAQMIELNDVAWRALRAAEDSGSPKLVAMAADTVHKNIELMAKLSMFAKMDAEFEDRTGRRQLSDALEDLLARTRGEASA